MRSPSGSTKTPVRSPLPKSGWGRAGRHGKLLPRFSPAGSRLTWHHHLGLFGVQSDQDSLSTK